MGLFSIRAQGTPVFSSLTGTLLVGVPTHSAGDLLLLFLGSSGNASVSPTHSVPGDWTLLGSAVNSSGTVRACCSVYWKQTAGGESDPLVTCTPAGLTSAHHSGVIFSVEGALEDPDPLEGESTNEAAGASSLALTLTTAREGTMCFLVAHHADDVSSGVTENSSTYGTAKVATDSNVGIDGFLAIFEKDPTASGSNGATVSYTGGGTSVGIAGVAFAVLSPPPPDPVGDILATSPAATSSMVGAVGATGTLASTSPAATSTMSGAEGVAGQLLATSPAASSSMDGAHGVAGELSSTAAAAGCSMAGAVGVAATLESTSPAGSSATAGAVGVAGALLSTSPGAISLMEGLHPVGGSMAATSPPATAALAGAHGVAGSLVATSPVAIASSSGLFVDVHIEGGGATSCTLEEGWP